jgi:hypothetical protein
LAISEHLNIDGESYMGEPTGLALNYHMPQMDLQHYSEIVSSVTLLPYPA